MTDPEPTHAELLQGCTTRLLEAISIGEPLPDLLRTIVLGVEEIVPAAQASILLVDQDGIHLRHGAAPSLPEPYVSAINGLPSGPRAGSCGTAVFRREPVIAIDIASDERWIDYRDLALAHGLRACWSMPVRSVAGAVLAAFAVYHREPRVPTAEDFLLLDRMAHVVRIAIERDRKEEELRESEERFRLLSRATSDVIWDWTLADDAIRWNDGLRILFGYEPDEVEETFAWWAERIHLDDRERVVGRLRQAAMEQRDTWTAQYRFVRRDGTYARIQDRGSLIFDAAGVAIRMVGGMADVTRQFELEAQLRQSQRLEAVGQLTGGIAHDFNNLLTVILGNADLLADELTPQPEQHALAETIISAARRGAALTHRLLAFARRQPLDPRPVDVNDLVGAMDVLLRRTIGEHIEIALARDTDLGLALVDPVQLEHALLNLCVNARDAMPDGGRITIETANVSLDEAYAAQHSEVRPGPYVLLAVSDTGLGIAPEHLAHVFDPFFTTKEIGKGTGLGLAMVYGFLKQSGGHVALYSEQGHGTTVRLYLPRTLDAVPASESDLPESDEMVGGTETILLVEDEAPVRQYAATQLTGLGYRVIQAEDGHQALDLLHQRPDVALLLTDVVLPGGLSGPMLVAEALALRPGLKVLYTSGYTANAMLHHGRLDAEAQLLPKPYRRPDLARKVRAALA